MIIEHNSEGMITHVVNDPIPAGLVEVMDENGATYLNFPPVKKGDETVFVECDIQFDYIRDGKITRRPTFDLPTELDLKVGETKIFQLPAGTKVYVDGEPTTLEDGELEIGAEMPAEYQLYITNFPYVEVFLKVTVHEA
jgi:hypothetical protein